LHLSSKADDNYDGYNAYDGAETGISHLSAELESKAAEDTQSPKDFHKLIFVRVMNCAFFAIQTHCHDIWAASILMEVSVVHQTAHYGEVLCSYQMHHM
jgi:hypothetical protein